MPNTREKALPRCVSVPLTPTNSMTVAFSLLRRSAIGTSTTSGRAPKGTWTVTGKTKKKKLFPLPLLFRFVYALVCVALWVCDLFLFPSLLCVWFSRKKKWYKRENFETWTERENGKKEQFEFCLFPYFFLQIKENASLSRSFSLSIFFPIIQRYCGVFKFELLIWLCSLMCWIEPEFGWIWSVLSQDGEFVCSIFSLVVTFYFFLAFVLNSLDLLNLGGLGKNLTMESIKWK